MTMHLAHPALTSLGKRKGKQKFRNADEARKARELEQEWAKNKAKWDAMLKPVTKKIKTQATKLSPTIARETPYIPSLNLGVTGAVTCAKIPMYTGDKIIGIGTMHKSNAVPIFNTEQAKDISTMRRN